MKKIILLLILISVTISSYAGGSKKQKSDYPKIRIGAEAGLNLARIIYYSNMIVASYPSSYALTWQAGAYSNICFNDKLTLQPELLYIVKGVKVPNSYTAHRNYIELPLLLKYNILGQFNIFGGPYLAGLISESTTLETTVVNQNSQSNTQKGNRLDMGSVVGIDYQYENGFNMGVKYTQGFHDISPYHGVDFSREYNMVFSLYVGWTFLKFSGNG